ncbi:MAG: transglutaminase family protein [Bryobacterales bacterium]
MIFRVHHVTQYHYDRPVFLEPQIIRLTPRSDPNQRLTDFRMDVSPEPTGLSQYLDAEGNSVVKVWFDGTTQDLVIQSRFLARTMRSNPFEFLLEREEDYMIPLVYPQADMDALARFCAHGPGKIVAASTYTQDVMEAARGETLRFLHGLNQRIYEEFRIVVREEGGALEPDETLQRREVSCRDVALLFVECARVVGLAARFVSGYHSGYPDTRHRRLHAWAEVFLPGAGWIGYDPTLGLAVADSHIAVAAAPTPAGAAAVTGSFRGSGVRSKMKTSLHLDVSRG